MKKIAEFDAGRRAWLRNGAVAATVGVAAAELLPTVAQARGTDGVSKHGGGTYAGAGIPVDKLEHIRPKLLKPPFVMEHEQATKAAPRVVEFTMTVQEKQVVIDEEHGTVLQGMTFNGSMPGPTLVVHEGDYVQLTLINPATNTLEHNIDFHASTGAMGGGDLTHIKPGQQTVLRFKATRTGTFIYHCAPPKMVPWHVVSGMSGVVMVLPRDGLKDAHGRPLRYDRVYTVGEFDLYIPKDKDGNYKKYETPLESFGDTTEVMRGLIPTHVVFNGKVGALTGANAMQAKVGETVLIIHSSANRDTRPHLIGGHGDYVWQTGKFVNPPERNLETWFVRGGSAGAALYTFRQPGTYAYLNHNLIEAFELGAAAQFKVEGTWNDDLMKQIQAPGPITA
ncbi:copper-containing nitrite reductase [Castellaniella sp. MT123]|uniref:copper-containing nitrite reductase n=1 Tax=Castellaniella sp. MT123 TaxID=3140381 RepID=UPI0031F38000